MNRAEILKYMFVQFGIPGSVFNDYLFVYKNNKIWICSKKLIKFDPSDLDIHDVGMLFAKKFDSIKPTTSAVQLFGRYATKNIIELNRQQTDLILKGYDIDIDSNHKSGYVILKNKDDVIGIGLLNKNKLKNQIPKSKRIKSRSPIL